MKIKNITYIFLFLLILNICSAENKKLIVKFDENFAPYEYSDNGEPAGFDIEIFKRVAEIMGIEYELIPGRWDIIREELETGKIDLLTGMCYSEKRDKKVDFTIQHSRYEHTLFVRKNSSINDFEDFDENTRIGVQNHGIMHDYVIENNISAKIITFDNQETALIALSNGSIDAAMVSYMPASYYIKKNKLFNLRDIDKLFVLKKYCFAVRKGDYDLLDILNQGLLIVRETGDYNKIKEKWFAPYEKDTHTFKDHLSIMFYYSLPFFAIIFIFYLWNISLKKMVKNKTEELIFSRAILENTFENNPIGEIVIKVDGMIIHSVNSEILRIFDVKKENIIGRPYFEVRPDFYMTENNGKEINGENTPIFRAIKGEIIENLEMKIIFPGGREIFVSFYSHPVYNDKGDFIAIVFFIIDLTERKKMEEIVIQNEKLLGIGGLAAGMAHEINNPLSGILQSVQNINRRLDICNDKIISELKEKNIDSKDLNDFFEQKKIFKFIEDIKSSALRASEIIQNMLSYSRKSTKKIAEVNIIDIIEKAIKIAQTDYDLSQKNDFRHINIRRDYCSDNVVVNCIQTEIEQVIFNILKNSAQAMYENKNNEKHSKILIRVKEHIDKNEIEIIMEDNGPGIPEKIQKKVFDPFFTTKDVGKGTGLGLAVSYYIISGNHSGRFYFESEPDQGTTFHIFLPV